MANNSRIEALAQKVDRLIADNRSLRNELAKAKDEKQRTDKQRRLAEQAVKELEQRIKILETAESFTASREGNRAARMRINKLIREIDSCIALINKW